VDLSVTVEIKQIRTLEKIDLGLLPISKIDRSSDPDFLLKYSLILRNLPVLFGMIQNMYTLLRGLQQQMSR